MDGFHVYQGDLSSADRNIFLAWWPEFMSTKGISDLWTDFMSIKANFKLSGQNSWSLRDRNNLETPSEISTPKKIGIWN